MVIGPLAPDDLLHCLFDIALGSGMSGVCGKGLYNLDFADLASLVKVFFDNSFTTGLSCFMLAFFLIGDGESTGRR